MNASTDPALAGSELRILLSALIALEKGRRFREGYRFRAGIEGRIHALKRDRGLRRSHYHGESGFGRWLGWGVVAHAHLVLCIVKNTLKTYLHFGSKLPTTSLGEKSCRERCETMSGGGHLPEQV